MTERDRVNPFLQAVLNIGHAENRRMRERTTARANSEMYRTVAGGLGDIVDGATNIVNQPINAFLRATGSDYQLPTGQLGARVAQPRDASSRATRMMIGVGGSPTSAARQAPRAILGSPHVPNTRGIAPTSRANDAGTAMNKLDDAADMDIYDMVDEAFENGVPLTGNPFKSGTAEHDAWRNYWFGNYRSTTGSKHSADNVTDAWWEGD